MRWLRRVLLLAVILAVMVAGWRFASENGEPVTVHYLAGELVDVPLWQVIVCAFVAGAGLVTLYTLFASARSGLAQRRYRKAIGGLEAEVHQLRNLPLAPEPDAPGGSAPVGAMPTGGASGRNG